MKYIIDTHVHTKEVSPCAHVEAAEIVDLYIARGYSGIIITDHYFKRYFENLPDHMSWDDKIDAFLSGYIKARDHAGDKGFDVFLSLELTFDKSNRDYIVYGITEEFLRSVPALYRYSIVEFSKIAFQNGLYVVQAHPFRPYLEPPIPYYIDAVEVFNGNRRHLNDNDLAEVFAKRYSLKKVSGSDFHQKEDLACGGMKLPCRISNLREFAEILEEEDHLSLLR